MNDSPNIIEIDLNNFSSEVIKKSHHIPVLVDFTADWCAPCRVITPIITKLAAELKGQVILAKVDTDEQQKLAGQHGIRGLPTLKLFRRGEVVEETYGAQTERSLREMIVRHSN
jgi:putative thioredoxin